MGIKNLSDLFRTNPSFMVNSHQVGSEKTSLLSIILGDGEVVIDYSIQGLFLNLVNISVDDNPSEDHPS